MSFFPVLKPKVLLKALLRAGFYVHHQTGSHARLFHKMRRELRVTVPIHNHDLPVDTLRRILQQADLDIDTIKKFL